MLNWLKTIRWEMKGLSPNQKEFFYTQLVFGRLRIVAKPVYDALIALILSWNRLVDYFSPLDRTDISDLSIVIKTFERDKAAKRLIKSIQRRYPSAQIIIVNDSQSPTEFVGVTNIIMPYDSGISAGRNAAIEQITTTYFLLLDDDFVFTRRQRLGQLLDQMQQYPQIDILGGRCIDLPLFTIHNFQTQQVDSSEKALVELETKLGDNCVVDKVQNFFIARTATIRKNKWNDALKVQEHSEFFTRARGVLVTAYRDDMLILHAKTPFDIAYLKKRYRSH